MATVIRQATDLWPVLHRSLAVHLSGSDERFDAVEFDGWPRLTVKLEPGDGRGTPEIMRAIRKVQLAVNCGYAFLHYGEPNPQLLSRKERRALHVGWSVHPGSTILDLDLSGALNEISRSLKQKAKVASVVTVILTLAAIFADSDVLATWVRGQADVAIEQVRVKGQQDLVAMVQAAEAEREEVRHQRQQALVAEVKEMEARLHAVRAAYYEFAVVRYAATDLVDWRPALMRLAPYDGSVSVNGVTIKHKAAKEVAEIASQEAKSVKRKLKQIDASPSVVEAKWITTVTRAAPWAGRMRLGVDA